MGEMDVHTYDEPMYVGKGSDDCATVSVIRSDSNARVNVKERHTIANTSDSCIIQSNNKLSKGSPDKDSTSKDIRDIGYTKEHRLAGKRVHIENHNTINSILRSGPTSSENRTSKSEERILFSPTIGKSQCRCNITSQSSPVLTDRDFRRKNRVFRITPRPYVPDPAVNRNGPRQPNPSNNVKGRGHICKTNSGTCNVNSTDTSPGPIQNSLFIERTLINDKTTLKEQTHTSQPLCEDSISCKANISQNRTHKKIDSPLCYEAPPTVDLTSNNRLTHTYTNSHSANRVTSNVTGVIDQSCCDATTVSGSENLSFEALERRPIDKTVSTERGKMGNTPPRRLQQSDPIGNIRNSKHSSAVPPPSANEQRQKEDDDSVSKSQTCTIPALIVSDSSLDQDMEELSLNEKDFTTSNKSEYDTRTNINDVLEGATTSTTGGKPLLRPHISSDSAYSSDSRCTSMDSASDPSGRVDDSEFCYQENSSSLLSPDNKSPDIKSISSSSSSSSSPSHPALATSVTSNDSTLRVMSEYGLQRKLSSSSGSSFRSSLSFEESEDDMLSSDGESFREHAVHKGRRQSKAQSSWTKIRRMVIWSPFMQSFKKKYPWVQLAGHAGNFQPGEEGCILKKFCSREADCLNKLSTDNALRPFAPEYHGIVEKEGEKYTRMQDLLLAYDCPSVMDCKMGVRTYLEDELVKAKIKPRLRHDMYAKMTEIAPEEPTQEEHEQRAVTKPRYMQWREHVSSSSNLGFRIEGIKKADNDPSKDYKLTKTKEQVKNAFKYFIDDNIDVLEKYIKRLKDVRDAAEKSEFFMSHEVIGSSLLFVHDKTGIASAWMIDFGKTSQLPDNKKLTHREEWIEGNREDGYLFGLDNLIGIFEEICKELMSDSVNIIQSTEVNGNQEPTSNDVNESDNNEQSRLPGSPLTLTLSSQSSAESVESSSSQPQDGPTDDSASTQNNTKENTRKPPLKRQTASSEPDACHQPPLATDPVTDNITNDAKNVNTDVANDSVGTINDIKDDSHLDESRGPGTT